MRKFYLLLAAMATLPAALSAQLNFNDVEYWVGSGPDTTLLVVGFHDATWDSCYAWGYIHDGASGEEMLNDIAGADPNFSVDISGGFLNNIVYGAHAALAGEPDYFSTWDGEDLSSLVTNSGLGASLIEGGVFACSYTDFDPAIPPGIPIAAYNPDAFTAQDVNFWVGSGSDSALFVVDFLQEGEPSSFAWGYAFNGNTTGEDMLSAIDAADTQLEIAMGGGFLNDIYYGDFQGVAGEPNYWATWGGTNLGNWITNNGLSAEIGDGDLFGCSYTDFEPVVRPGIPVSAQNTSGLTEINDLLIKVYPNPSTQQVHIEIPGVTVHAVLYSANGKLIKERTAPAGILELDVRNLPAGMYLLNVNGYSKKLQVR